MSRLRQCGGADTEPVMAELSWCFLGRVDYATARHVQVDLAGRRSRAECEDVVLTLEHPPVLTLGRSGAARGDGEIAAPVGVELVRTDRGGSVTYHGPGQLV